MMLSDFAKQMRKQVNSQRGGIRAAAKVNILQSPHLVPFKKETKHGKETLAKPTDLG